MPKPLTRQQSSRKRSQPDDFMNTFGKPTQVDDSLKMIGLSPNHSLYPPLHLAPSSPPVTLPTYLPKLVPLQPYSPMQSTTTPRSHANSAPRSHPPYPVQQTPMPSHLQHAPVKPTVLVSPHGNAISQKPLLPVVNTPTISGLPASPNASYGAGQPLPYPVRNFVPHPTANPFSSLLPNGYAPSSLSLYGPSNRPSAPAPPPSTTQMPPVAHPSYGAGQPLPYPQHQMGMSATPHLNPFERAVQAGRTLVQRGRDAIDDYVDYQHSPNGGPAQYHRLSDDLNSPAYNPKSVTIGGHMVNGHWVGGHKIGLADNGFNLGKTASMMLDGTVQAPLFIWNANQHSLNTRKEMGLATINALAGHQKAAAQHWHNMQKSGQQSADDSGQIIKGFTNDFLGGGDDLRNAIAAYKSGNTAAGNAILKQFGPDVYNYVQTHKLETALTVAPHLIGGLKFGARKIAPRLLTAAENNRQLAVTRGKSGDTAGANQAADMSAVTRTVGTKLQKLGGVVSPKPSVNTPAPLTKDSSWQAHMNDANQKMKLAKQSIQGVEIPASSKLIVKPHSHTTLSDIGKPTTIDINGRPVVAPLSKDASWQAHMDAEVQKKAEIAQNRARAKRIGDDTGGEPPNSPQWGPSTTYYEHNGLPLVLLEDTLNKNIFGDTHPGFVARAGDHGINAILTKYPRIKPTGELVKALVDKPQVRDELHTSVNQALSKQNEGVIFIPRGPSKSEFWKSVWHESVHMAQAILGGGSPQNALKDRNVDKWRIEEHPAYQKAYEKLLLKDKSYANMGWHEIPAYIAGGEYKKLGLTQEEAWELIKAYTTDLVERHGMEKASKVFSHSHELARDAAKATLDYLGSDEIRPQVESRSPIDALFGRNRPPLPSKEAVPMNKEYLEGKKMVYPDMPPEINSWFNIP